MCIRAPLEIEGDVSLSLRGLCGASQVSTRISSQTFAALAEPLKIRAIYLVKCLDYLTFSNFQVFL